jgi:hypothetical protein
LKRKRITSVSRGNKFKFQQQSDPISDRSIQKETIYDVISDLDALANINSMSACCSKSEGIGCFASIFQQNESVNFNDCIKYFKLCRTKTQNLTTAEKIDFVGELYKTSVVEVGTKRNKMVYMLYGKQVCRTTIITAYGFTKFFFDQCIQNLKTKGKIDYLFIQF